MPFGRQYGFVVQQLSGSTTDARALARTIAHELGHGRFSLRHTFSQKNVVTLPQGQTDNLMDYSTGTSLLKYQWDFIHDPQRVWFSWLEGEEEGEEVGDEKKNLEKFFHSSGREYGWLSAEQESNKEGCAVGYDNEGGCSYGKHQIAARKTLSNFVDWLNAITSNQYSFFTEELIDEAKSASSKNQCFSCSFTKKWMEICNDENFIKLQQNYIIETHYKPLYNKVINTFGNTNLFKNMTAADEEALKEMCISLGVQHGKAFSIFQMALLNDYTNCSNQKILDRDNDGCSLKVADFPPMNNQNREQIEQMKQTANTISMSQFIDRVYAARKLYVKANNTPNWENMILKRYENEPEQLKETLGYK